MKRFNYKHHIRTNVTQIMGAVGTIAAVAIYLKYPSFLTPDKLLVFLTFVFMIFGRGWQLFKHLAPLVALLIVYESFRGLVPSLNTHVNYMFMPAADKFMFFGHLPTTLLQNLLWTGHVRIYDFAFYGAYMLHFILPIGLALLVWKFREKDYWRYITTFLVVSFAGFLMFLAFPAAPPWMASQKGYIEPITRVSSSVWQAFGVKDFPSLYNRISPNPVAAMPSLHAAYATLIFIFVYKFFGKKWAALAAVYPFLIYVGTVYQGEHYAIDELAGIAFGIGAYYLAPFVLTGLVKLCDALKIKDKITYLKRFATASAN